MKKLVYSPDALEKMRQIKMSIGFKFGTGIASNVISKMTAAIRDLQNFEMKGVSIEKVLGIPCDYRMLYLGHNYVFYRIDETQIYIVAIFDEREDFMWKLFGIRTTSQETEDYWNE